MICSGRPCPASGLNQPLDPGSEAQPRRKCPPPGLGSSSPHTEGFSTTDRPSRSLPAGAGPQPCCLVSGDPQLPPAADLRPHAWAPCGCRAVQGQCRSWGCHMTAPRTGRATCTPPPGASWACRQRGQPLWEVSRSTMSPSSAPAPSVTFPPHSQCPETGLSGDLCHSVALPHCL